MHFLFSLGIWFNASRILASSPDRALFACNVKVKAVAMETVAMTTATKQQDTNIMSPHRLFLQTGRSIKYSCSMSRSKQLLWLLLHNINNLPIM